MSHDRPTITGARALALALALLTLAPLAPLAAQRADSTGGGHAPLLTRRQLVATGVFTAASLAIMPVDTRIARWMRRPELQDNDALKQRADDAKLINEKSLFAANALTWAVGRLTHSEGTADFGLHAAEAVAYTTFTTTAVRVLIGRTRPFKTAHEDAFDFHPFKGTSDQAYRSFPSLHSAAAYATATVLTSEVRRRSPGKARIVGPVSYAIATLPGLSRMYADKHWASDVALGMVWGTAIGAATTRFHHTRGAGGIDRWLLGAGSMPTGETGMVVTMKF